ncbi:MAG: hypothetical protein ACYC7A_16280 [Thermoanaerobaculia bacterium]
MNETTRLGPPRDRRASRRYMTARNFRRGILIAAIVFTAVSVYSEFRGPDRGQHGRLYERRVVAEPEAVVEAPPPIVESPVAEAAPPDPLLVEPQVRSEWLGVDGPEDLTTTAQPDVVGIVETGNDGEPVLGWNRSGRQKTSEIVIAGGAGGVRVARH